MSESAGPRWARLRDLLSQALDLDPARRAAFADHELTPASAAMQHEMQQRLQQAIAALPEDDREVILMRHVEQLSNQEVATALKLSEAAASMRHLRALRRLRALIAPPSDERPV